ncbi:hypothetical protein LUZ60_013655 [Juncus effusus]|nr:hypothetical protein LUZ60_013655 [Juncus effusus]
MSEEKETALNVNLETTINGDEDRLSNLPDDVLITILSLLDAKEIIQTWLLSKRWCHLWRFVPRLKFCDDYLKEHMTDKLEGIKLTRFQNFVSSFLLLRDNSTDLHTFKLRNGISSHSLSWIRYVLNHNPKILDIDLLTMVKPDCCFDQIVFTCESLEDLSFGLYEKIVLDEVSLPNLRKLFFGLVLINHDSVCEVLCGCPVLENLSFWGSRVNANELLFKSIKQLTLFQCELLSQMDLPRSFPIFGPELEYLKIEDCAGAVELKDMSKVKKVRITNIKRANSSPDNCEYLSSFSCVEDLKINNWFWMKKILEKELQNCPTFHNLKKLALGTGCIRCGDFDELLPSFLKRCPNLERLKIFHKDDGCEVHDAHNDLDAHELVELLVKSTSGMDQVQIILKTQE